MKFFNKKLWQVIGLFMIFAIPILIAIYSLHQDRLLKNNHKFTIGVPYQYKIYADAPPEFEYFYFYNEIKYIQYESDFEIKKPKLALHKRFYVMFNPDNPKNSKLLLDFPVPDSIREAPPEGWDKIPNIPDWQQPK